jgi:hypothetical protein
MKNIIIGEIICLTLLIILFIWSGHGKKTKTTTRQGKKNQSPVPIPDFGFDSVHYELPESLSSDIKNDSVEHQEVAHKANHQSKLERLRGKRSKKKGARYH